MEINEEERKADGSVTCPLAGPESRLNLTFDHKLNLHLQEYAALRAEQRTRLDSANKIIHYSAVVLAAMVVGLLSVYKPDDPTRMATFRIVLLFIPLVLLPLAFTQQNEEILVRHIGNYLDKLKADITFERDSNYWGWETFHARERPGELVITGFFRAGLLIIFSALALSTYYGFFGRPKSPLIWIQSVQPFSLQFALGALQALDLCLTIAGILVGVFMFVRYKSAAKLSRSCQGLSNDDKTSLILPPSDSHNRRQRGRSGRHSRRRRQARHGRRRRQPAGKTLRSSRSEPWRD